MPSESSPGRASQPVSVLMPTFNAEQFIEEAIRSILEQTHRNLELIVLDDGSTDETLAIASRMAAQDARVRVESVDHGGVSRAMNFGVSKARHEWISIMNADDIMAATCIERILEVASENPAVLAWGVHAIRFGGAGFRRSDGALIRQGRSDIPGFEESMELGELPRILHGGSMYRKTTALEVGGYNERYSRGEDLDFFSRVAVLGPILSLPEVLYQYRFVATSLSNARSPDPELEYWVVRRNHRRRLAGKADIELDEWPAGRPWQRWNERRLRRAEWLIERGYGHKGRAQWGRFLWMVFVAHVLWPERPVTNRWRPLKRRLRNLNA